MCCVIVSVVAFSRYGCVVLAVWLCDCCCVVLPWLWLLVVWLCLPCDRVMVVVALWLLCGCMMVAV